MHIRKQLITLILLAIFGLLLASPWPNIQAQTPDSALLSLQASETDLQTGHEYRVDIHGDNINELWLADMEISYDPKLIYVIGTKAGSPIKTGSLWSPAETVAVVRDTVTGPKVVYTVSMLAPANPISGSGIIGSFRIYALSAGNTEITFSKVGLLKAKFATDDSGQRVGTGSERLPFTPVLVKLNITGQTVSIPPEATATPVPTETPVPTFTLVPVIITGSPTPLANATAQPTPTPTPLALQPLPQAPDNSPLLGVSILLVAGTIAGLIALLYVWSRSRRRRR